MTRKPLSKSTLAAFAAPAAPIAGLGLPLVVYLPPFYAREMALGLTVVGTIFMVVRFWDVITDPVLGILSDRITTRWGRRRHWIVLSTPILLASVYYIFMPTPPISAGYLLTWMVVLYVGWTLLTISHISWGAELSPEYNERSRVQGWREIFLISGMVTTLMLPAIIERADTSSSGADRVAAMGWFIILLLPLTVALAVTKVPERPLPQQPQIGWRRAMGIIVENAPLRRVLAMDLVGGFGAGIVSSLFLFLASDTLKLGKAASLLLLVYFVAGVLFIPLILRLSYRFGKHRTLAGSSLFNAATLPLLFLVPEGSLSAAAMLFILFGVNMGAGPFLFRSLMADVADHDRVASGAQRTGLYFSLLTMTNKVGHALSIGLIYPLLEWFGYVPGAEQNTSASVSALTNIYVWLPAAFSIAVAALMWNYPLDIKKHEELRLRLDELDLSDAASVEPGVVGKSSD